MDVELASSAELLAHVPLALTRGPMSLLMSGRRATESRKIESHERPNRNRWAVRHTDSQSERNAAARLQVSASQSGRVKDTHARVGGLPGFPRGRHVQAKHGNIFCNGFRDLLLRRGAEAREAVENLFTRIRAYRDAAALRELQRAAVERLNTRSATRAGLGRVLEDDDVGGVQF